MQFLEIDLIQVERSMGSHETHLIPKVLVARIHRIWDTEVIIRHITVRETMATIDGVAIGTAIEQAVSIRHMHQAVHIHKAHLAVSE